MRVAWASIEGYDVRLTVRAVRVEIRVEDPSGESGAYERHIGGSPVLAAAIVGEIQSAIAGFQSAKTRSDANWTEVERTMLTLGGEWHVAASTWDHQPDTVKPE
jgi:hypothetical protein